MGRQSFTLQWSIIIPAVLLLCLGLVTLLSVEPNSFWQQLIIGILGVTLFLAVSRIDFNVYPYLDRVMYVASIIFLLLTYLGPNVRGSTRWLEIFGFQLQPSELIKPIFILSIASFLTKYPPTSFKRILMHVGLFIVPFFLIFHQPDLGNAIVYLAVWLAMIVLAGIPLFYIIVTLIFSFLILPFGFSQLRDYQKLRIMTFLDPLIDPRGAGYNAIQAMIAVGSGKLFGRGFGRGTQSLLQFLPERHTDFIFAAFAEEFGFLGSILLLLLFFLLLWQIIAHIRKKEMFGVAYLYAGGVFMYILTQVIINIGMNMGVVPITGITLPFVSYGGSSLLSLWFGLGLLVAAYNSYPE